MRSMTCWVIAADRVDSRCVWLEPRTTYGRSIWIMPRRVRRLRLRLVVVSGWLSVGAKPGWVRGGLATGNRFPSDEQVGVVVENAER